MKKIFYPLFALAAMAMTTSCSDELESGVVENSNEATVSFKVQLENNTGSRAAGDGALTKYVTFAVFKAEDGKIGDEIEALRQQMEVQSDLTAQFTTSLVKGQTYNFVFWAQNESVPTADEKDAEGNVTKKKGEGTYYNIADMSAIKVNYTTDETNKTITITGNEEKRDAFYAAKNNLKITGPINETITLKRPFAQLNVGTSIGSLNDAATAEVNITKSKIVLSQAATELYPYSGQIGGIKGGEDTDPYTVVYESANILESLTDLKDGIGDLKDVAGIDYEYLSMNYVLVADQNQNPNNDNKVDGSMKEMLANATFTIYAGDEAINTFDIPNVPIQRNWRTNIIGDIMNSSVTFNIVIDPKFDNDYDYITKSELNYILANGGEYTLQSDVEGPLEVAEGKKVILNLNGFNVKSKGDGIIANKDSEVTINGEGSVLAATEDNSSANAVWALDGGKVTINGGYYYVGADGNLRNDCIYAKNGGEIIINGGKFEAKVKENDQYWVLNLKDNSNSSITVYGGEFVNFDPANNKSEGEGTNFVAENHYSVKGAADANGNVIYTVYKATAVKDATTWNDAVTAKARIIDITKGFELPASTTFDYDVMLISENKSIVTGGTLTFKGENVVVKGIHFRTAQTDKKSAIYVYQGNKSFTLDGCYFTDAKWEALQYVPSTGMTDVTIQNCVFNSTDEVKRYLHLEVTADANGTRTVSNAIVTIKDNKFYESQNCDDSVLTLYGFSKGTTDAHENFILENNAIYHDGSIKKINDNVVYIRNGFGEDNEKDITWGFSLMM